MAFDREVRRSVCPKPIGPEDHISSASGPRKERKEVRALSKPRSIGAPLRWNSATKPLKKSPSQRRNWNCQRRKIDCTHRRRHSAGYPNIPPTRALQILLRLFGRRFEGQHRIHAVAIATKVQRNAQDRLGGYPDVVLHSLRYAQSGQGLQTRRDFPRQSARRLQCAMSASKAGFSSVGIRLRAVRLESRGLRRQLGAQQSCRADLTSRISSTYP